MQIHTIVAVDDNEAQNYALSKTLEIAGFVVKKAFNGSQTLTLAQEKPDLIVLDVNLPDLNGFEICRRIRENPDTKDIPVVFLSATYQSQNALESAKAVGAQAFLFHPVHPEQLLAVIRGTLARSAAAK